MGTVPVGSVSAVVGVVLSGAVAGSVGVVWVVAVSGAGSPGKTATIPIAPSITAPAISPKVKGRTRALPRALVPLVFFRAA